MCRKALRKPESPSIVSRMDAPDDADDERCRLGLRWRCGRGTSRRPFDRDELRLRLPIVMGMSRVLGGTEDADDEERDVGDVSDEDVDVLDMVGMRADARCLCTREGY
jgi:hypothetical protein